MVESPRDATFFSVRDALLMLAVCAAAVVLLGKDISRGGLADPDASAHVMDGVLIHDWLLAGPQAWIEPVEFAKQQYGHYPTLGIGGHYPPGFAVLEAAFFLVLGISATAARLCVVFFGALASTGCFVFMRSFADRSTAVVASVLLAAVPGSTLWGRQVMLEVPLMASLVWAAAAFAWYLRSPSWGRLLGMCGAAVLTVTFKQSGVFLVCAIAFTLGWRAIRRNGPVSHAVGATIVAIATLGATLATMDDACLKTVSGYTTHALWSAGSMLFYPRAFPELVGWVVLVFAVGGMVLCLSRLSDHGVLLFAWFVVSLIMVTAASLKTPRFGYVATLPLVAWAALAGGTMLRRVRNTHAHALIAALIAIGAVYWGYRRPVAEGPAFDAVVARHRRQIEGEVVLFSGLRDGDFVFAVREGVPWRNSLVVRGSKLFYTCTAGPDLDLVSYADSPEDVAQTMRRYAFSHVFVERDNRVGAVQEDWLRDYLRESGEYVRIDSILVQGEGSTGPKVYVDAYRLAHPRARQVEFYDIPVPRTRETIRVDLRRLSGIQS